MMSSCMTIEFLVALRLGSERRVRGAEIMVPENPVRELNGTSRGSGNLLVITLKPMPNGKRAHKDFAPVNVSFNFLAGFD